MLHLLPDTYIKDVKKEYRIRSLIAICNLLSFCFFTLIIGSIPAYLLVVAQKNELEKRSSAITLRVSNEDKAIAKEFELAVKRGINITKNTPALSSADIDYILLLSPRGIVLTGVAVMNEAGKELARVDGTADTRTDLSNYIRTINEGGVYTVQDVPASTFTKDRDILFHLVLEKKN